MIGGQQIGQLSKRTTDTVRVAGLVYCSAHVVYGLLAAVDVLPNPHGFPLVAAALLGAAWMGAGWWQYSDPDTSTRHSLQKLVLYMILSAVYLVWVIDLTGAFATIWALPITLAALQYSWRGFIVASTLLLTTATGALAIAEPTAAYLTSAGATLAVTLFIALSVSLVLRQSLNDQRELDDSHAQAALQRDRTTALINNLADAVISTDAEGKINLYNASTLNLLDTNTSLDNRNIDEILRVSDTAGKSVSLSEELLAARAVTIRDDLTTIATGEQTRLEITYAPIRRSYGGEAEEGSGYIIILRDVTKTKSLEEERDEFISVVSHELRTPITIAEGTVSNAQLMLARGDIPMDKVSHAVDVAHDQIVFLARMVNDLSTLSRAERGVADEAEIIDINELIDQLYAEYRPEASAKGLKLDLKVPAKIGSVSASRLYLKELLQNFITNAIKYTNEGSVTIEASVSRKRQEVTLGVSDTGVGISKIDQKRIFDKFYRAEDYRTRETNGTGLGLYVATKLARKLGTRIDIKSRLNYGSLFSITLPLEAKPKAKKASKS